MIPERRTRRQRLGRKHVTDEAADVVLLDRRNDVAVVDQVATTSVDEQRRTIRQRRLCAVRQH